jgi:carotenoid cleavage dioxygenase-like enzyme
MEARESELNPFLKGNFGPWRMEGEAPDLEVVGELPRELLGTYYRNGPNPAFEPIGRYHWFDGDGMIHAIRIEDGRAHYRNRWVASEGLKEERAAGRALYPGLLELGTTEAPRFKVTGNTNTVFHAKRLLALVESSLPTELDARTLETTGLYDFGGRLAGAMTAHPKLDPVNGEMLFFGYSPFPPYLQYHVVDASGAIVHSEPIDIAWPSMIHDFAVTEHHAIFLLCPVVFDFEKLAKNGSIFSWEPERGTRIGVMPRRGTSADVQWFETDPCYVFHPMNAYEDGDEVVLDVHRYGRLQFMSPSSARDPNWRDEQIARLHRWRLDLVRGGVRSEPLDDHEGEFPRVDERLVGRKHRFGYFASTGPEGNPSFQPEFTSIAKIDLERGSRVEVRAHGAGNGCGEPVFVPRRPDAAEDDGWVLYLAYDRERNASELVVVDAREFGGEPVARVRMPHRVPYGFHGNWVADAPAPATRS